MHGRDDSLAMGASAAQLSLNVTSNHSIHARPVSRGGANQPPTSGRIVGSRLSQTTTQGDIISQTAQKYMAQFAHSLPARTDEESQGSLRMARADSLAEGPKSLMSIRGSASMRENRVPQSVDAVSQASSYRVSPVMRQAIDDFGSRRQSETSTKATPSQSGLTLSPPSISRRRPAFHPGQSSAGGSFQTDANQSQSQMATPFQQEAVSSKRGSGRRQTINFLPNGDVEVTGLPLAAMKRLGQSTNSRPSSSQQVQVQFVSPHSLSSTGGGVDDPSGHHASGSTPRGSGGGASHFTGSVASSGGGAPPAIVDASHFAASVTSQGEASSSTSSMRRPGHPSTYVPSMLARTASGGSSKASGDRALRVHLSLPANKDRQAQESSQDERMPQGLVVQRSKLSIPIARNNSEGTRSGGSSNPPMTRLEEDEDLLSSQETKGSLIAGTSPPGLRMAGSYSGNIEEQGRTVAVARPFPSSPLAAMALDAFHEGDDGVGIDDSDEDTPADTLRGHYEGPMSLLGQQLDPYHGQAVLSSSGLKADSRSQGTNASSQQTRLSGTIMGTTN
jgi:hypothetical protein